MAVEKQFGAALDKAKEQGRGIFSTTAKFFNAQVPPALMPQLKVARLMLRLPTFFCSRNFVALSPRKELRSIVAPEEATAAVGVLRRKPVENYEQCGVYPAPRGPRRDDVRGVGCSGVGGVAETMLVVGMARRG